MATTLNQMKTMWRARSPRERHALLAAAAALGFLLLWSLYAWTHKEAARLDTALPKTRAQLAAMQEDAAELDRLRAQPAAPATPPERWVDNLKTQASALGLSLDVRSDPGGIAVTGGNLSFDLFTQWLAEAQRSQGLRTASLEVLREGQGVRVAARLVPN